MRTRNATNRNARGGSDQRRRRKQWLLDEFGDGEKARCAIAGPRCIGMVVFETLWVDRYPIKGADGGTYQRGNIRPSCGPCNMLDGGHYGAVRKAEKKLRSGQDTSPE